MNAGCAIILRKLVMRRNWGGSHLPEARTMGWVKHQPNKKAFEKSYKELIKNEWLLVKQNEGERHISLNPEKGKEIKAAIEEAL